VVTHYPKEYLKELEITNQIEAYLRTIGLRKFLKLICFELRRDMKKNLEGENS
jgi:hypothetical protein